MQRCIEGEVIKVVSVDRCEQSVSLPRARMQKEMVERCKDAERCVVELKSSVSGWRPVVAALAIGRHHAAIAPVAS
jgi:hypothetical protein